MGRAHRWLLIVCLFTACRNPGPGAAPPRPVVLDDQRFADVVAFADSIGSAALLIVSDSVEVLSHGDVVTEFRAHSIRKSFLSALLGIAAASGDLDLEASMADLGIDDRPPLSSVERRATVRQLMEARSGVYHAAASETPDMRASRPTRGSHAPGTHWFYNNWDFNALGTIYENETGLSVGAGFEKLIAEPLGMRDFSAEDVRYQVEDEHSRHAAYKFRISARDLALFGQLYLADGRWGGRRLLPPGWVRESTALRSPAGQKGTKSGYGMMWWVTADGPHGLPVGSFTASGTGGQRLTIIPDSKTVVVHLMNTDEPGPRIGTSTWNELLRRVLAAVAAAPVVSPRGDRHVADLHPPSIDLEKQLLIHSPLG